jgi:hypothetical protein
MAFIGAGCEAYQQQLAAQQAYESAVENIIITPGDINRPYNILGTIQWPGVGYRTVFGTPCNPDKLREEALKRWGTAVNALIGYTSWNDGGQIQCSGTAVQFSTGATTQTAPQQQHAVALPGPDVWRSEPPGAILVQDWASSAECQAFRRAGGSVCDEHHLSVVPVVTDVVRQEIDSSPAGLNVFVYYYDTRKMKYLGRTPFEFVLARQTIDQMSFCAGPCLGPDLSRFVRGQARDVRIVFEQDGDGWVGRVGSLTPTTPPK